MGVPFPLPSVDVNKGATRLVGPWVVPRSLGDSKEAGGDVLPLHAMDQDL